MLGPSEPANEMMLMFAVDGCALLFYLLLGDLMGVMQHNASAERMHRCGLCCSPTPVTHGSRKENIFNFISLPGVMHSNIERKSL